jgi:hypothetical protein
MALLVPPSVAAQSLKRDDVLADAARYAEHTWEMRAANQKGACQGAYQSDHALGQQSGVPYAWGGWMDLAEFDRRIAEGQGAGSHSSDGILSCVAGVDCSGFVSQVWRLKQRQSTSTLNGVTKPITLDELRPGDALNKAGKHVVLFAGTTPEGKPIIYEASGSASRVRLATPSWSYLNGYQPIRYPGLEAPPVVASVSVPATPAPAPAAPAAPKPAAAATQVAAAAAVAPAVATPASSAPATVVPAVATPASSSPATVVAASASAAPSAPAPVVARRALRYGVDVGFQPASEDEQALGPDHLTAGPKGVAALYDRVRGKVLVLSRDGAPTAFDAGRVDGLSFTREGNLVVIDSSQRQLRIYRPSGELQRTLNIPREGALGALSLEDGVLYATSHDGQRRAIAELAAGRFRLPQRTVELSKEQLLSLKDRVGGGQLLQLGGESHVVPEKARVSVRRLGSWMELVIAATDTKGGVHVARTLRRNGQVVALPDGARGSYAPVGDLAVSTDGTVVYLEPGDKELTLAWVDPA